MAAEFPHPEIEPLLEKYDIEWSLFSKRGRPPAGVSHKRKAIVTELHISGMSWKRMVEVTGMSHRFIQLNTQACWNEASRENRRENARKTGRAWKGKKRPEQLETQWANGCFDHLRGRKRTEAERANLRKGWTREKRKSAGERSKARWGVKEYRESLLAFHRSPEEKARRSREQARRMEEEPEKWTKGRGQYVDVKKEPRGRFWIRSRYELAAVLLLEQDKDVVSYCYEKTLRLPCGRVMKPDFTVKRKGCEHPEIVEVKASWVLGLGEGEKVSRRLSECREEATKRGWSFAIWTEKDALADVLPDVLRGSSC